MKHKLSAKEYIYVASMLFGLFFGAGNLIFPVHLGQMAGSNVWLAILGLLITGVGLPLLGVAALGISRSNGLFDLSSKVNRPYAMFFTCALYLTIGPFFAIPRCATTTRMARKTRKQGVRILPTQVRILPGRSAKKSAAAKNATEKRRR